MYIEIRVQWTINLGSSHMHSNTVKYDIMKYDTTKSDTMSYTLYKQLRGEM